MAPPILPAGWPWRGEFPGIMAPGVFRRVDNIINEAVTMGTAARTNILFPNYTLFENVQALSNDGNDTATNISAFYMLHIAYDITTTHNNTTSPVGCFVTSAGGNPI
jgi:hypothetical protein